MRVTVRRVLELIATYSLIADYPFLEVEELTQAQHYGDATADHEFITIPANHVA